MAQGRRVRHRHDLWKLWNEVGQHGKSIQARPDPAALDKLTTYAGEWQYPAAESGPEATCKAMAPVGEDLLNRARRRVPVLMKQTEERLKDAPDPKPDGRLHPAASGDARASGFRPAPGHAPEQLPTVPVHGP